MTSSLATQQPQIEINSILEIIDGQSVDNYTKFLLLVAHYNLLKTYKDEIKSGIYNPDPGADEKWAALCYQEAYRLTNRIEKLTIAARLRLVAEINENVMYASLGYSALQEWLASQADMYAPRSGAHFEMKIIANTIVPYVEQAGIFDSAKEFAEWLTQDDGRINRLRAATPVIRAAITAPAGDKEKKENVTTILKAVESPAIPTQDLRRFTLVPHKARAYKNGSGWVLEIHFPNQDEMNRFLKKNSVQLALDTDI